MSASSVPSATSAASRNPRQRASRGAAFRAPRVDGAPDVRPARLVIADDDLRRQVLSRISQFGPQAVRAVTAEVRSGDVTLAGVVDSDYERQLIEQSVARLAGVGSLENRLRVRSGESTAARRSVIAMSGRPSARQFALAATGVAVLAIGWGLWQFAVACTG